MPKSTRLLSWSRDGRAWRPRRITEPAHDPVAGFAAVSIHADSRHHGRIVALGWVSGDWSDSSAGKLCGLARRDRVWVHAVVLGGVGGGAGDAEARLVVLPRNMVGRRPLWRLGPTLPAIAGN